MLWTALFIAHAFEDVMGRFACVPRRLSQHGDLHSVALLRIGKKRARNVIQCLAELDDCDILFKSVDDHSHADPSTNYNIHEPKIFVNNIVIILAAPVALMYNHSSIIRKDGICMEELKICNLLDLEHTIAKPLFESLTYAYEALGRIREYILQLGPTLDTTVFEQRDEDIWVAKSAVIAPTASLNGPLIIDEGAEVRHCAFIRGAAIVGKNAVVGNSTELKNCVLFDNVQVPHYNYVGDSIYGYRSHTGAGTIASNLKSDKSPVAVNVNGTAVETGIKKFGAVIGDYVEVGCNSVMNPGTVIGRNTSVYPLSFVRGYVAANSIYKRLGEIAEKI